MASEPTGPGFNRLLEALPPRERKPLLDSCENVELAAQQVLYEPGDVIRHIHFPTTAFVSQVSVMEGHAGLQSGLIGNEGALGYELMLDIDKAVLRTQVQRAGTAWRLAARLLLQETGSGTPALRRILNRYAYVLFAQSVRSGACCRFHLIEERLARWLLTAQDCAHSSHLALTHDALAGMLGVRRVGITNAASALQRRQLIDYRRGVITIRDRTGLETAACSCYQANLRVYADLLALIL